MRNKFPVNTKEVYFFDFLIVTFSIIALWLDLSRKRGAQEDKARPN